MRRFLLMLLLLVTMFLLVACGATKTTYYHDDPANPTRVTRAVEEDGDFFESKNLANHYESLNKRADALVQLHKSIKYDSKTSEVLGGMLIAGFIDRLGQSQSPRTMADVLDRSLPEYFRLGLAIWDRVEDDDRGKRTGSPDLIVEGNSNNLIFDSQLGTGDGSRAQFWFGEYADYDMDIAGESSGSFNASRPYSFTSDDDWTRSETRVDSPSKSDSSLF
ncbi:MAG: hypothetical protein KQH59_18095 [Desulfobulbaceae bacterium]|nr:hypothetical protein [Desulfobulbaceae bacterium]